MNKKRSTELYILLSVIAIAVIAFTGCTKDGKAPKNNSGIESNTPGYSSPTPTVNPVSTPSPNKGIDFGDLSTKYTPIPKTDNGKISPVPIESGATYLTATQTASPANTGSRTSELPQTPQIHHDKDNPTLTASSNLNSQGQWTKPIK